MQLKTSMGCCTSHSYLSEQTLVTWYVSLTSLSLLSSVGHTDAYNWRTFVTDIRQLTNTILIQHVTRFYKCVSSVRGTRCVAIVLRHPVSATSLAWTCCRYMDQKAKKSGCDCRQGSKRWRSWLRHCATAVKVTASIPYGVIGIFHWHNPSGPGVDSASNRTSNTSWGVKPAGAYGWQPYHLHVPIVLKSGSLNLLEPSGTIQACNGIALPLPLLSAEGAISLFS
jgi:hypothetical protein